MAKRRSAQSPAPAALPPDAPPRWLILTYEPVSLFSLRSTLSMSKGGKTLLIPTPYSIKMAFIDSVFRSSSSAVAEQLARTMFDRLKARRIRIRPPAECVVQNTFVKINQDYDPGDKKKGMTDEQYRGELLLQLPELLHPIIDQSWSELDTKSLKKLFKGLYAKTIAYRELVYLHGRLEIALDARAWDEADVTAVSDAAMHVNYFGKRGSFFQFQNAVVSDELLDGFTLTVGDSPDSIPLDAYGVTQYLDDFGPDLCKAKDGFERISTFHSGKIEHGKHRVLESTLVPYHRVEATKSFTRYSTRPLNGHRCS